MKKTPLFALAGALLILASAWNFPVLAVNPDEILADPVLEGRAREISKGLRCLVCQNQSIDDSDAGLAKDLRVLVRERLTAGDNDDQVVEFVVARYGDFVLLKPPFMASTLALWLGPNACKDTYWPMTLEMSSCDLNSSMIASSSLLLRFPMP